MYIESNQRFAQRSEDVRLLLTGFKDIYQSSKSLFSSWLTSVFLYLGALPFLLLMVWLRFRLKKIYPAKVFLNTKNYKELRSIYDNFTMWDEFTQRAKRVLTEERTSYILKFYINECIKTLALIFKYREALQEAFLTLDSATPNDRILKKRTETELWENRNLAYEFKI